MKHMIKVWMYSSVAASYLLAGGSIADPEVAVEPYVEEVEEVEETASSPLYMGVAYGYLNQKIDNIANKNNADGEWGVHTVLLQLGIDFSENFAIEGRYWYGLSDASQTWTGLPDMDLSGDYNAWGIYAKVKYPLDETITVYGLLGYAGTNIEPDYEQYWKTENISYGIGISSKMNENVSVFADYTILGMDDRFDNRFNGVKTTVDADLYISTINVGVSYHF